MFLMLGTATKARMETTERVTISSIKLNPDKFCSKPTDGLFKPTNGTMKLLLQQTNGTLWQIKGYPSWAARSGLRLGLYMRQ
jgi:hypothetical protein